MVENAAVAIADDEPEAPYQPVLTAEERAELRREWLEGLVRAG